MDACQTYVTSHPQSAPFTTTCIDFSPGGGPVVCAYYYNPADTSCNSAPNHYFYNYCWGYDATYALNVYQPTSYSMGCGTPQQLATYACQYGQCVNDSSTGNPRTPAGQWH